MHVEYHELSFGFELELTGMRRATAANVVSDFFDTGRPVQLGGWGADNYECRDRSGRIWKIVKDASIQAERRENTDRIVASDDYQVELVSPPLTYADLPMIQELIRDLRSNGALVNKSCGMHVHVGAERFTPSSLRVLCNIIYAKQDLLIKALDVHGNRRKYCQELDKGFIQRLNKKKPKTFEKFADDVWYQGFDDNADRQSRYNDSRYRLLNLHQFFSNRLRTLEFRLFNSTLHAGKVKAYIQLSLLIAAQALSQKKSSSRITVSVNGNDKYAMRVWLLRMGAVSDEFKSMRHHALKYLDGNSAWRDPPSNEEPSHQVLAEIGAR